MYAHSESDWARHDLWFAPTAVAALPCRRMCVSLPNQGIPTSVMPAQKAIRLFGVATDT